MVVALAKERKIRFYGSRDLRKWEFFSDFGPAVATEGVWECPDLFQLEVDGEPSHKTWILKVDVNPGAVAGGSGGQYFIGKFNGLTFTNHHPRDQIHWVDYGKDFYAAQSWSNIPASDGRRLWLGWISNWQYANEEPTSLWRGAQSIPRVVTLKKFPAGIRLVQKPVRELSALRGKHYRFANEKVQPNVALLSTRGISGDRLEIVAEFQLETASEFGFKVRQGPTEETLIGYMVAAQSLFIDRTKSGNTAFSGDFPGLHGGPLMTLRGRVRLHIFVDRSVVEVFGNGGQTVITDRIYPNPNSKALELYAKNGSVKVVSLNIWELKSTWNK